VKINMEAVRAVISGSDPCLALLQFLDRTVAGGIALLTRQPRFRPIVRTSLSDIALRCGFADQSHLPALHRRGRKQPERLAAPAVSNDSSGTASPLNSCICLMH